MLPSANDLKYFITVCETENISRAAERLGISQPSLTLAMQRLENCIGESILERSRKGVNLTRAGQRLHQHALALLEQWENIKTDAVSSVQEVRGTYTIGCHPSVAQNILPFLLPDLYTKHPDLNIKLYHAGSRDITEDVISARADIGYVVNPVQNPDLVIHPLYTGEITLWRANTKNRLNNPASDDAVLIADFNLMRTQDILKQCKAAGIHFNRTIPSDNIDVIKSLVESGCGIGIMPAKDALRNHSQMVRIENTPAYRDDHCIIYRYENKKVKGLRAIVDSTKRAFI